MELSPELLLRAYAIGIFPMAESRSDTEVHWIDPDLRGVLPLEAFHAPRGLRRKVRKKIFDVRCNSAFPQTIERLYGGLHEMGFAHSVECWQDDRLVGGLYGVSLGAAFFGESMFSVVSDASKVALVHLVARLRKSGFLLLDTQFETPHLRRFGVVEIPRDSYREQLANAVRTPVQFPSELTDSELSAFLQSITQTS
jgi:leucyl/phenylalanyl-tRNA--protein transferase